MRYECLIRNVALFALLVYAKGVYSQESEQKKKGIVDDSTKEVYTTRTTFTFTKGTLLGEYRQFFKKDSILIPDFPYRGVDRTPHPYMPLDTLIEREFDFVDSLPYSKLHAVPSPAFADTSIKDTARAPAGRLKSKLSPIDSAEKAYQRRFYKNNLQYTITDTLLTDLHNYNQLYYQNNIYQNLGMYGTANKKVFPTAPNQIHYRSGFEVFDLFYKDLNTRNYYNSRSPFTFVEYTNSTVFEDLIRFEFNRNVLRNWNVGFGYQRMSGTKNLARTSRNNNYLAHNQNFNIFTSYKSNNERYYALLSFGYFVHKQNEQGGLRPVDNINGAEINPSSPPEDYDQWPTIMNESASFSLNPASLGRTNSLPVAHIASRERRVAYNLYQQFDVLKGGRLSIFADFEQYNQRYLYIDHEAAENHPTVTGFYPRNRTPDRFIYDTLKTDSVISVIPLSDTIRYKNHFLFASLKSGLKGQWNSRWAWIMYYTWRNNAQSTQLNTIYAPNLFSGTAEQLGWWIGEDPKRQIAIAEQVVGGEIAYRGLQGQLELKLKGEALVHLHNKSAYELAGVRSYMKFQGFHQVGIYARHPRGSLAIYRNYAPVPLWMHHLDHPALFLQQPLAGVYHNGIQANVPIITSKKLIISVQPSYMNILHYTYLYQYRPEINTYLNSDYFLIQHTKPIDVFFLDIMLNTTVWKLGFDYFGKWSVNSYRWKYYTVGYRGNSESQDYYQVRADYDPLRMPEFYQAWQIYYKLLPKSKKGRQEFRFGFDVHYRSYYYGDAYVPFVSQFAVQDQFLLSANTQIDFFAQSRIRNARVFFRLHNLNQLLGLQESYFVTPYYVNQRPFVVFGVKWKIFE